MPEESGGSGHWWLGVMSLCLGRIVVNDCAVVTEEEHQGSVVEHEDSTYLHRGCGWTWCRQRTPRYKGKLRSSSSSSATRISFRGRGGGGVRALGAGPQVLLAPVSP